MKRLTPGQFSKLVVIFCIIHLWTFSYLVVILAALDIAVPDVLITCNFAFFGTELVGLLILKVARIREEKKNESNE